MITRYENTKTANTYNTSLQTKLVYTQTIIPTYDRNEKDIYFYSRSGDRLDLLANEFYNDVTLWPVIASANNLGKGTLSIPAGKLIRIPYKRDFKF